jgi:multidrug transporter EmrE-like cation transporter
VSRRMFCQRATPRELFGMTLVVAGVALLLATAIDVPQQGIAVTLD